MKATNYRIAANLTPKRYVKRKKTRNYTCINGHLTHATRNAAIFDTEKQASDFIDTMLLDNGYNTPRVLFQVEQFQRRIK